MKKKQEKKFVDMKFAVTKTQTWELWFFSIASGIKLGIIVFLVSLVEGDDWSIALLHSPICDIRRDLKSLNSEIYQIIKINKIVAQFNF